jgi:ISXO2-like transposase domain
LTVWFAAAWQMTSQKHGISALGLKRVLGIGSEQTAWAMLHRYRTAMVRPGRDRLGTIVEVDETVIGGPQPGRPGRGALGKTLVAIAVEQAGRALGRCRMQIIDDASTASLRPFLLDHVASGTIVITDGWPSYPSACGEEYTHQPEPVAPSGLHAAGRASRHRWCSAGCWAPTKAASSLGTCRHTWTSSRSASTAGALAPAGCCSTACSSSPFKHPLAPTGRSSPTPGPAAALPRRHRTTSAYGLRASLVSPSIAHGVTNQPENVDES